MSLMKFWSNDPRELVVELVVAVNRYVDGHNEGSPAYERQLWRAMTSANEKVAEKYKVYPL